MDTGYIIIPDPVLLDERLNIHAKILFGQLYRLSSLKGFCWASNGKLAEIMNRDDRSVQRWIKELADCEYIHFKYDGNLRQIYCVKFSLMDDAPVVERKRRRPKHDKPVTSDDSLVVTRQEGRGDSPVQKGGDSPVAYNNTSIKNTSTSTTTGNSIPGDKPVTPPNPQPSPGTQQVLALRPSGYWEGKRHDFLQNKIFLEKFSMAKRIPAAATAALMEHFCTDLELRNDHITSADRLQNHFTHWFNLGITKGYILQDGTLKNQPPANPQPSNEHQQPIRPWSREISGDDILLKYGNDRERAQAATGG